MTLIYMSEREDLSMARNWLTSLRFCLARIVWFVVCGSGLVARGADASSPYPTAGGAGAQVITVTSLADSGPGSFREALTANGPRIVRFAVGGEIWIKEPLQIREPFITIEGESAPSPGISIMGDKFRIRSHDVIVRNIRVRVGDLLKASDAQNRDGMSADGAEDGSDPGYNVLVENCSIAWSVDEGFQMWGLNNHDIVVRNCIIGESLAKSVHPKGGHSAGMIVGPGIKNVLIQGNLFAHNSFRNPVVSAGSSAVVLNNVIYDPGFAAFHVYGRQVKDGKLSSPKGLIDYKDANPLSDMQVSVIGNVAIRGPSTSKKPLGMFHEHGLNGGAQIYLQDNLTVDMKAFDDTTRPPGWDGPDAPSPFVKTPPIAVPEGVKVLPSSDVEASVLANVGARPADRDEVDKRIIEEVKTRTGKIKDHPTDDRLRSPDQPKYTIDPKFQKNLPAKDADAAWMMVRSADDTAEIKVISISEGSGIVAFTPTSFTLAQASDPDQWKTAEIKFKASADADVLLRLSARYASKNDKWVYIDNIKATGITVENPDFETASGETPAGWQFRAKGGLKGVLLHESGFAASGTGYVKVAHGTPVVQTVRVTKDTEVTLSFTFKTATK